MSWITKNGLIVQERILKLLKEERPLSTRQISLKLQLSWHTVQQHCLYLFAKKKLEYLELASSYIWVSREKKTADEQLLKQNVFDSILNEEINTELQKVLASFLPQVKEKMILLEKQSEQNARESKITAQHAGGENNEE